MYCIVEVRSILLGHFMEVRGPILEKSNDFEKTSSTFKICITKRGEVLNKLARMVIIIREMTISLIILNS